MLTFTIRITNTGIASAPAVTAVSALPTGLTLIAPLMIRSGPGDTTVKGNLVTWQGSLAAGQSVVLTYVADTPPFTSGRPAAYYNAVQLDNGAGHVDQSELWVIPQTFIYYMPLMMKK